MIGLKILKVHGDKDAEHDAEVVFACVNQADGFFLTCDNEGLVKLWSKTKQLISEFKFLEEPASAIFLDSGFGLLMGHSNIISEIRSPQFIEQAQSTFDRLNK